MKYQKRINLLDDTTNQQSKFRTRKCVEMNHESRGTYNNNYNNNNNNNNNNDNNNNNNNNINFKMLMIRSN